MKNKKTTKASPQKPTPAKVKDIAPKKSPKGGAITQTGDGWL